MNRLCWGWERKHWQRDRKNVHNQHRCEELAGRCPHSLGQAPRGTHMGHQGPPPLRGGGLYSRTWKRSKPCPPPLPPEFELVYGIRRAMAWGAIETPQWAGGFVTP